MAIRPIVIDKKNMILGGNMRYKAIEALEMKEIPDNWVIKAENLTPAQRRRFIVVDNAPDGMAGEWDLDLLNEDWSIPELEELGLDIDFDMTGLERPELETVDVRPPNITWVLIAFPTNRFGEISEKIEAIAGMENSKVEMTVTDDF